MLYGGVIQRVGRHASTLSLHPLHTRCREAPGGLGLDLRGNGLDFVVTWCTTVVLIVGRTSPDRNNDITILINDITNNIIASYGLPTGVKHACCRRPILTTKQCAATAVGGFHNTDCTHTRARETLGSRCPTFLRTSQRPSTLVSSASALSTILPI